jgi:hypothetical protein
MSVMAFASMSRHYATIDSLNRAKRWRKVNALSFDLSAWMDISIFYFWTGTSTIGVLALMSLEWNSHHCLSWVSALQLKLWNFLASIISLTNFFSLFLSSVTMDNLDLQNFRYIKTVQISVKLLPVKAAFSFHCRCFLRLSHVSLLV